MAWIRNESGSIVPFRRSILPNKPFLATLRCLSLSFSLPYLLYARRIRYETKSSTFVADVVVVDSGIESPAGIIFFRGWTWLNRHRCGGTNEESRTGRRPFKRANRRRGTPRRPSAARQMQFYASLSLVSSPPPPLLCLHRRARDPRDFTRGSRGGDATVLSTDDASENREERLARRCLFDYGGERALRLMFARWIRRWLKGGKDLGWYEFLWNY